MSSQLDRISTGRGFIAALDQSGGSTPKALEQYGVAPDSYSSEEEMFDLVHQMRTRIVASEAFTGDRIIGAILFEATMDREVEGLGTARYLWERKQIVPFLKIDKGLAEQSDGVQLLKPIPDLADLLARGTARGVFGTKERSLIHAASPSGIEAVLDQQFELADTVLAAGLVPIVEPEVSIAAPDKAEAEALLRTGLLARLAGREGGRRVILKLTLPTEDGYYAELVDHPGTVRVVALSGGYSRDEANAHLARNPGVIASFSRALSEGLRADQSDEEFDRTLDGSIEQIYRASLT